MSDEVAEEEVKVFFHLFILDQTSVPPTARLYLGTETGCHVHCGEILDISPKGISLHPHLTSEYGLALDAKKSLEIGIGSQWLLNPDDSLIIKPSESNGEPPFRTEYSLEETETWILVKVTVPPGKGPEKICIFGLHKENGQYHHGQSDRLDEIGFNILKTQGGDVGVPVFNHEDKDGRGS